MLWGIIFSLQPLKRYVDIPVGLRKAVDTCLSELKSNYSDLDKTIALGDKLQKQIDVLQQFKVPAVCVCVCLPEPQP